MTAFADSSATGRRLDLMGDASFPASDPPAAWTWERDRVAGTAARGVFQEVVIGADGTPNSQLALRTAALLRADGARLLALSVAEIQQAWHTGLEMGNWTNWLRAAAEEARRESVHQFRDVPNAAGRVADGRPAEVLLASVRSRDADLLAIGAGRYKRALGLVFGSTATVLARDCPCSVLVGRGEIDLERFPQRIVVGVDGSPHAADAEALGRALAKSFGCELHRVLATGGEQLDPTHLIDVDDLVPRSPVAALVDASHDADLVIVGSRGLRGLKALGSVAERLAHRAACPVLIARLR